MDNLRQVYFDRESERAISEAFKNWRIVLLFGARQIGKTTMADKYFNNINAPKKKILGQNKDV